MLKKHSAKKKVPEIVLIKGIRDYRLWDFFSVSVKTIKEKQSFNGVELLVPGDRGRVTRSGSKYGYETDTFSALVESRYPKYVKFIEDVLSSMTRRFEPWPKWLTNCDAAFNFGNDLTSQERCNAFQELMKCQVGPSPLLAEDKRILSAQFVTLCMHADTVVAKLSEKPQKICQNDVWYKLLTEDSYYKHCKKVNAFALRFLNRSFNEAVVEFEVSNLKQTSTETRALKQRTTEMLNFISTNGPHPLVSMSLVDSFLSSYFGKDWHFCVNVSKYFISQCVDARFKAARQLPNSLADI